jgi:dolichol kinase
MTKSMNSEILRKSIHISSLLIPLLYKYAFSYNRKSTFLILIPVTLAFIIFDTIRIEHRNFKKFYQNLFGILLRKHELNDFTGAVYVMVSAVISIAIFPGDIAFLALSFLSIGDTLAAMVGIKYGKRVLVSNKKSIEGSIACFVGIFVYGLLFKIFDHQMNLPLGTILVGAVSATLAEAWKIRFDDNIKIPLISGFFMYISSIILI